MIDFVIINRVKCLNGTSIAYGKHRWDTKHLQPLNKRTRFSLKRLTFSNEKIRKRVYETNKF